METRASTTAAIARRPATRTSVLTAGTTRLEVVAGVAVESLYYPKFTSDSRQFLRAPALRSLIAYDTALQRQVGVRVRARDCYRPYTVQQKGFCWGIEQILRDRELGTLDSFKRELALAMSGQLEPQRVEWLLDIIKRGNRFFSYVKAVESAYRRSTMAADIVTAAANFAVVDGLELDKYAPTAHASGGVADVDWFTLETKPFNVGVPVDHVGIEAAIVFFEPGIPTVLTEALAEKDLTDSVDRIFFYRWMVKEKPLLAAFLTECGVNVERLLQDDPYLLSVCEEIRANRRIVVAVGSAFGIIPYGEECWHLDFDNRYGGVAVQDGLVSGGGTMAAYLGQERCAWGCATKLWERIVG